MRIARAFLLVCALASCTSDPHREPMPTDLQHADSNDSFKSAVSKLPEDERQLLAGYLVRATLALAPEERAKTIGAAIESQRTFLAQKRDEEQRRAEEEKRATAAALKNVDEKRSADRAAMQDAISVEVVSVSLPARDVAKKQFGNELSLSLIVRNTSKRPITQITGWLDAKDGNTTVRTLSVAKIAGPLLPGEKREWKGVVPINAPREPFAPTSATWIPHEYALEDGTKLWWGPP